MIKYTKGNLLEASTEALVNTVNTVGVMGKGIALQFKKEYPANFRVYAKACKDKSFKTGELLVVKDRNINGEKLIINFPTKAHWRGKSKYEYIVSGLKDLQKVITEKQIKSIAIPPLGCGNGGLDWLKVKTLLEQFLGELKEVEILIYEPNDEIKTWLKENQSSKIVQLTTARAMLLYAMFYYETLGEESNLFVANKLAYFFQRIGVSDFKRLNFKPHYYGPYSEQISHILHDLNGAYLKGMEQMNVRPFESIELQYGQLETVSDFVHKLESKKIEQLKSLIKLISGFQSALSLETLATVDYILKDKPSATLTEVTQAIQQWSSRKGNLFQPEHIRIAYEHLQKYSSHLEHLI